MTHPLDEDRDQPLIHEYIRIFGHPPTAAELARYRRRKAHIALRRRGRLRVRLGRLITRQ